MHFDRRPIADSQGGRIDSYRMLYRVVLALEPPLRQQMERVLAQPDLVVSHVDGGARLVADLEDESADLVVVSRKALPGPARESIPAIRALPERPELLLVVDREDGEERARLLAAGALAVLPAGLEDRQMRHTLRALVKRSRETALARLKGPYPEQRRMALEPGSTASPAMRQLLHTARRVAASASSLLIQGETGSGKEWLARAIHGASGRTEGPFIAVNCAALSETLLDSELFGHERGAFTGAERARRGHFEMAHRGTLFLDEIGDLPLALQAKLLRVVEEKRIQRLGSETSVPVDVRVMAATHHDLQQAVEAKTFRADLFYRLAVVELTLPSLRERREDIPELARRAVDRHRRKVGRGDVSGISGAALEILARYHWPGNIRELTNVLERAVLLTEGPQVRPEDLPHAVAGTGPDLRNGFRSELFAGTMIEGRRKLVEAFEREYLARALEEAGGRVGEVALRAGIDVRTLRDKLKLLGLHRKAFRGI